ncbi:WD40 repeat domain-containing protein [Legionella maioricensis]|uniref:WD40 repeat domain-containing protein n=1 Tax=Legionella maioricensis TaxID=2896528 RepID=A0A9X2IBI1_9GAMM|nr:WD40 repeat domain-containing protein [Legionella maioricensis]MCL9684276.1 WD40 repeat domain-containing protein [Legionella maioricensis]MCL9687142.1 WD40 repeat domain-containing protein [Legionella maioricensis]
MQNKNCFFQQPLQSREIPNRAKNSTDLSLQKAKLNHTFDEDKEDKYSDLLCRALWGVSYQQIHKSPILGFSLPSPEPIKYVIPRTFYTLSSERCLDAPGLSNNYYYQPINWATETQIYIGLESKLYSYNVIKRKAQQIEVGSIEDSTITALAYNSSLSVLARAGSDSSIQFIDPLINTQIGLNQETSTTTNIVSDMSNGFYMIGQTSGALVHYDLRDHKKKAPLVNFPNAMLIGLAFNHYNLAISTDTCVQIYDSRRMKAPRLKFEGHNPPSKALAFSPNTTHRIVTGGGAKDKNLIVWNTDTGKIIAQKKIDNQICGVHWLDRQGIFVAEGYSGNRVSCWSIEGTKLSIDDSSTLHTDKVLFSAQHPVQKEQLITAASGNDEKFRFWTVKNVKKSVEVSDEISTTYLTMPVIR